jgi:antitoxin component YwqK of YwqJK toxin-antitoxin module
MIPAGVSGQTVYRSNVLGMELEELAASEIPTEGYALRVTEEDGRAERRLYQNGELIQRVVQERSASGALRVERVFESGTRALEEGFTDDGLRSYRLEYDEEGQLLRELRYEYEDGKLAKRRVLGPGGTERYTDTMAYYPSAGLRRLRRAWADGDVRIVRYSVVNGNVLQERFESDDGGRLVRYDEAQRAVYEREWSGAAVVREEHLSYEGDSQTPTESVETLPQQGRRRETRYDEEGRVIEEMVYENDRLVREVEAGYGPHGVRERILRTRGRVERHTFSYVDETLAEERVYVNGELSRSIAYFAERSRVERRYRDGEVFVRIYYEGGTAVREEIMRNGSVVETRELD